MKFYFLILLIGFGVFNCGSIEMPQTHLNLYNNFTSTQRSKRQRIRKLRIKYFEVLFVLTKTTVIEGT